MIDYYYYLLNNSSFILIYSKRKKNLHRLPCSIFFGGLCNFNPHFTNFQLLLLIID